MRVGTCRATNKALFRDFCQLIPYVTNFNYVSLSNTNILFLYKTSFTNSKDSDAREEKNLRMVITSLNYTRAFQSAKYQLPIEFFAISANDQKRAPMLLPTLEAKDDYAEAPVLLSSKYKKLLNNDYILQNKWSVSLHSSLARLN